VKHLTIALTLAVFPYAPLMAQEVQIEGDFATPVINALCDEPQPEHGLAYIWQNGKCVAVIR